jgi:uncharacterized membrane protein
MGIPFVVLGTFLIALGLAYPSLRPRRIQSKGVVSASYRKTRLYVAGTEQFILIIIGFFTVMLGFFLEFWF